MEDLVVFSVLEHTPWKRSATYQVPDLPACPEDGCTCAWLWVPKGCGQPNMYMQGFKCMVTGATSTTPLGKAQPPAYCDGEPSKCVSGPKQMIVWNQMEGNNVVGVPDVFLAAPGYNSRNGFTSGPQTDIFQTGASAPSSAPSSSSSKSASIVISLTPSAPTQVQSQPTTMSTMVKPGSTSGQGVSSPVAAATTTSSVDEGSPVTVTVTVTASPTHSGHHYTSCWVEGEETDD
jgi:hypothetical protein